MNNIVLYIMGGIFSLFPTFALALNLSVGKAPAPISQVLDGEILLSQDNVVYRPWNSQELQGKVRVVQHFAARSSAKALNDPLIEALIQAKLPQDKYQTTSIINLDDAIWGTSGFARSKTESGKKQAPHSQVIVDNDGVVKKAWDLQAKTAMTMVLDRNGIIRFVKEGKLTPAEITQVILLLKQQVAKK